MPDNITRASMRVRLQRQNAVTGNVTTWGDMVVLLMSNVWWVTFYEVPSSGSGFTFCSERLDAFLLTCRWSRASANNGEMRQHVVTSSCVAERLDQITIPNVTRGRSWVGRQMPGRRRVGRKWENRIGDVIEYVVQGFSGSCSCGNPLFECASPKCETTRQTTIVTVISHDKTQLKVKVKVWVFATVLLTQLVTSFRTSAVTPTGTHRIYVSPIPQPP